MCLHYLGKFEVSDWAINTIIKCIFEWLTEWQQTIAWLAVIVSQNKSHVSPHIIFITVCAQNVCLQHERKRVDAAPLAYSTFNNRVTQSGPLAVDASFQFVDVRDKGHWHLHDFCSRILARRLRTRAWGARDKTWSVRGCVPCCRQNFEMFKICGTQWHALICAVFVPLAWTVREQCANMRQHCGTVRVGLGRLGVSTSDDFFKGADTAATIRTAVNILPLPQELIPSVYNYHDMSSILWSSVNSSS